MRRVGAVLAAIAMIVAAIVIRRGIDEQPAIRLYCAPEIAEACNRMNNAGVVVTIEAPAETAGRLVKQDDDAATMVDAWLAPAPWAANVDSLRVRDGRTPLFGADSVVVARTPLVIVTWTDRADALLRGPCDAEITWKCLGDAAGSRWESVGGESTWGSVKVGHADPSLSGVGLALIGHATAGFFGETALALADLDGDDAYGTWFTRLERSARNGSVTGSPLSTMLAVGRSSFAAVGATEAEVASLLRDKPVTGRSVRVTYSTPAATADLVGAAIRSGAGKRARATLVDGRLGDALADLGWRTGPGRPTGAPASAPSSLLPTSGLPPPGLLESLYTRWKGTT